MSGSVMGTKFSKLEWLTLQCICNYLLVNPGAIRSTYPILKGIPCATTLIFSSYPSCIESGDNKFTGKKRFFAEQIAPETINFLFLSPNCIFNLLIFI
jgi:hypothetical protein